MGLVVPIGLREPKPLYTMRAFKSFFHLPAWLEDKAGISARSRKPPFSNFLFAATDLWSFYVGGPARSSIAEIAQ